MTIHDRALVRAPDRPDPVEAFRMLVRLRAEYEVLIEHLRGKLDALDALSEDLEADDLEADMADDEPMHGAEEFHPQLNVGILGLSRAPRYRCLGGDQTSWGGFGFHASADEAEGEDEHGGDVSDEPHDEGDSGDCEPEILEPVYYAETHGAGWTCGDVVHTMREAVECL